MTTERRLHNLLNWIYERTIRPHLPYKISVHNGVPVRRYARLFDFTDTRPDYENALLNALSRQVKVGDHVVIVGGGIGVSAVVAARRAKPDGFVTVYEAGKDRSVTVKDTLSLNQVSDYGTVQHAIIGSNVKVIGETGNADVVSPKNLPECDVLELDCEGAELEILRNLAIRPRVIIVETHAVFDSPEDAVRDVLGRLGYQVVERGVEVESEGVFVLTAVHDDQ